uniref:Thiol methyltransferase 1B n=1 Tax=Monodelphis domestica TaxID=13616 RepID=H9H5X9_MONDO
MDVLVFVLQTILFLLTLPLHLLALLGCWKPICSKYFPYLMAALTLRSNQKMEGKKRELFSQIKELAGASGQVALLELGCGTGANFEFYPADCRVTCIDPNPHFEKFLAKSMAKNKHLQYEQFLVAPGEDMSQVADGSMDVVVCTLVLCSVQSPSKVLQEVQRVLKPRPQATRGLSCWTLALAVPAPFASDLHCLCTREGTQEAPNSEPQGDVHSFLPQARPMLGGTSIKRVDPSTPRPVAYPPQEFEPQSCSFSSISTTIP